MNIRRSSESHLRQILDTLSDEYDESGEGFYGNRNIIESSFQEGTLYVYRNDSDVALGFVIRGNSEIDILWVREDLRRSGIGKALATHALESAYKDDLPVLSIQCDPKTSIPFWESLGFQISKWEVLGETRGYYPIERKFDLPEGEEVKVLVEFFPEDRNWDITIQPCKSYTCTGVKDDEGIIHLPARIIFPADLYLTRGDAVVSISVDGNERYNDKAKYEEAISKGVEGSSYKGFYIDKINHD